MSVQRGNDYGNYGGRWPAIVREYLPEERMCRVEIPGITDGADLLPLAEIEYSIGDKSIHGTWPTEILILPGDEVWIAFVGGDPRYPIITGYRNARRMNSTDVRQWHQTRIVLHGYELVLIKAGGTIGVPGGGAYVVMGKIEAIAYDIEAIAENKIKAEAGENITLKAPRIDLN